MFIDVNIGNYIIGDLNTGTRKLNYATNGILGQFDG